ncbi:LOW QUALITY PROTEIN: hemicentin-2 [Tachyglossus aculeatus]|uniref:LOW QUALITY PROTEIN: hemicentin-2 n=1 Tax=Tachyglossus aculeatus TaxID=9261 RepID=UPI0018F29A5F|nr:LOW QUALITY PROTEIN: hemicentin-2 [Tachyglossus aculeatus]
MGPGSQMEGGLGFAEFPSIAIGRSHPRHPLPSPLSRAMSSRTLFLGSLLLLLLAPQSLGEPELPPAGAATLAFVFDVTGSMWDDLVQVVEGATKILERSLNQRNRAIGNYVLVPFHDPDIGPVTLTSDPQVFQRELRELYVQGGGDCPEMSMGAIKVAVEISNPGSFIYVFSDARAKDHHQKQEVLRLLQRKQSQVVFVLTGDCGDRSHPGYLAYEEIAATSSGQVFHLDKQQVNEVLKWVEEAVQASKVHLLSTDHDHEGEHTWRLPFDPSLKEVTISLSGPGPEIEVRDPLGRIIQKDEGLKLLLNIPDSAKVVAVKPQTPGLWSVKVYSSGRHSVRITGVSSIDFRAGFSTQPSLDLNQIIEWPLQGVPISLVINSTGLLPPGHLDSVELSHSSGRPLLSLPTRLLSNSSSGQLWGGPPFQAPRERFYLKVKGEDQDGNPLHRVSGVAYTGVVPGSPQVSMPGVIRGYLQQPLVISCSVQSPLPFRLQLRRDGVRLGEERHFYESGNSSWEIPRASKGEEGAYECLAISRAGMGRAWTDLVVTDPPPRIVPPQNVTVSPGETAILSCLVLGAVPYNLSWVWERRVLSDTEGRVKVLGNLSLEIGSSSRSDGGRYQCVASNADGLTKASTWLFVREAPQVSISTGSQDFSLGGEVRISCTASGIPVPRLSWRRQDHALGKDSRFLVDAQGTLIIQRVSSEDAGNYSCHASNEVGTDEQTVTLYRTELPTISAVSPEVQVQTGEEAVLQCVASGVPPPRVIWYRGGLEMILAPDGAQTGTLRIQEAQQRDAGEYTCKAVNEVGASSAGIRLHVGDAPRLVETPLDVAADEGQTVILPCRAEGSPPPKITWARRDGKPVAAFPRLLSKAKLLETGALFLENVTSEDQAVYICRAQNDFGKVQVEAKLTVSEHDPPQIASSASVVRVLEGQPVSLPCVILAGKPYPERRWLKDDNPPRQGGRLSVRADGSFHIDQTLQEDTGKYSCIVANAAGSRRQDVRLVVQVPPRIQPTATHHVTNEGVPVSLPCVSTGVPKPAVSWSKETNALSSRSPRYNVSRDGSLLISQPGAQDAGAYVCTATNAVGFSTQEIRLSVNTKPKIIGDGSHDPVGPVNITAVVGQELTLSCEARGSPPPLVTWKKESQPLPPVTDRHRLLPSGSLRLEESQVTDSGLYTCTATNPAGTTSRLYVLGVQVPPQLQPGPKALKVLVGQSLDLPCVAEGQPVPQLSWTKNGVTLRVRGQDVLDGPDGSIHLEAVRVSDAGHYRCVASSGAGEDALELNLDVLEAPHWDDGGVDVLLERVIHERATLHCPARGTPTPTVVWRKDSAAELLGSRPGRTVLEEDALVIAAVSPEDSGDYECLATNEAGSARRRVRLVVHVPPTVREEERRVNVSVMANQALTLDCDISGVPAPTITWYKDGQPISGRSGLQILNSARSIRFPKVGREESGLYTCSAVNRAGEAQRDFHLLALVPPSLRGSKGTSEEVSRLAGSEVILECRTEGVPLPQVEWTKDGQPLPLGGPRAQLLEDGQVLRIPSSHLRDEGQYQCLAFSQAGQQTKDFLLKIYTPPTIWASNETTEVAVMQNHDVRLQCEARGSPAPSITWYKDEALLSPSAKVVYAKGGRQLQLGRAQGLDAGLYVCKATNVAGVAEKAARLEVYVPPTIEGSDQDPLVRKAVAGQPLALACTARGHPEPTLTWHRDGLPLVESNGTRIQDEGQTLRLESVAEMAGGLYSCLAKSPAGETVLRYSVEVQVPPQLLVGDDGEGEGRVTAIAGDSLALPCHATGSPAPTVQWLRNGRPVEEQAGMKVSPDGTTLQFGQVQIEHAGPYACQAGNEAGTAGAEVELTVHERPSVTIVGGDNITAPFLQPVTIRCMATGTPAPSFRWWKDGVALPANEGSLQIEKADLTDEGIYTCAATNLAGEDKREVTMKVLVPPNIEPGQVKKAVLENTTAVLECLASGVPPPKISWFKWRRQLASSRPGVTVSGDGRVLRIERTQLSDTGSYRCVASNVAGTSELQFSLRVNVPPRITLAPSLPGPVVVSEPVRLVCNASGVPTPTLLWLKDGNPVSSSGTSDLQIFPGGRVLTLSSARVADSGMYSCVAVSVVGEDRRDLALQVHLPPSILGEELNVSVVVNKSVTLECQSHAVPPPVLSWLKDGRPLAPRPGVQLLADGAFLQVEQAKVQDVGRYTCEALNKAGRSEKHYNLNVLVPPYFSSEEPRVLSVTEGHPASLTCECRGIPFPRITWKKDGVPLPSDGENKESLSAVGRLLFLGRVQTSQEGNYSCECSNVAGSSRRDQRLEVHAPPKITNGGEPLTRVYGTRAGTVSLECEATGRPPPMVKWEKDGRPVRSGRGLRLEDGGRTLLVEQAQSSHTGRYVCVAENAVGQDERRFDLLVQVPPELTGDTEPLKNVTAALHSTLTLYCEATGVPPPTVRWFHGELPIIPEENTYFLSGGWILKLMRVQEKDKGLYSCLASNEIGDVSKNFSVDVLVPPSIVDEDAEEVLRLPEGQAANFSCNATGNPKPVITWFKDGRLLPEGYPYYMSPDGSFLQINQVNLSSSGHYSCIAANSIAERTKHYQLSVLVAPTISGVTEESADEDVTVTVNNPISLICEALAFPSPTVTWMKDGLPFEASRNVQLLPGTRGVQILNAQEDDAGRYTCVVTNEVGEATKNYHVEVLIPPSISKDDPSDEFSVKEVRTKVNSTLTLECESWAVPPPTISWYKDGQLVVSGDHLRIQADGRLLQIQPTRVSDSGRYLCVATNVAGEDDKDFNVLIQVPPMFQRLGDTAAFEIRYQEEEQQGGVTEYREIVENSPTYLYCDTNAVPPPKLTWYRDGQPLSSAEGVSILQGGRVLQISMVRTEDAGRYTCKATNEVGEDWLHYELLVLTAPVIQGDTEELVEEVTVNANSTVSLQCQALGNPTPAILWLRNGLPFPPSPQHQTLEDGRVLQVSATEVTDADSYMCLAENQAGSAEKMFTLKVQVPPRIVGPNPEQVVAIVNNSVSLTCNVQSHPGPEVTWYKEGQTLTFSEEIFLLPGTHTLQLPHVQLSDTGSYTCEVLNAAGRDQKLTQLNVYAPPIIKHPPGDQQDTVAVRAGDTAVLQCESDTLPEPVITWYKNGHPMTLGQGARLLLGGQRLELENTQVVDKGLYSCKVSNVAGEAVRTFVLTVQVPPAFENPQTETVSQAAGSPLVLSCDVSGVPAPTVIWLRDRLPIESSVERGVVSRGGRLQISRLQPSQGGTYTCLAENPEAVVHKDFVVLVLVPPRILSSGVPQEHSVLEDQEVRLDCAAEGQPRPDISWLKDGSPLGQLPAPDLRFYLDGDSLILKGLRASDSGAYTCLAHNSAGEDTKLHTLNVLVPPTIERGANDSGMLLSIPGGVVTMACPVRGSSPIQVSWLKGGLPLPLSQRTRLHSSGRTLRISQVQVADAGTFTCVASSQAGVAERSFVLRVQVPPVLETPEGNEDMAVTRGSSVTFPCEARGSPPPIVSWLKDGDPLVLQNNQVTSGPGTSLHLEEVQATDSGTYDCRAENEAGEASKRFWLSVMEPPHIKDSDQSPEVSLVPSALLELVCDAMGIPTPNVTWQKDGQSLPRPENVLRNGRVLRIEGVQVEDAGLYTCLAVNPAGEDGKSFWVRIQAPPNIVGSQEIRSVIGLAQGQLVLECPMEADPPPRIEWHREGVLLQADAHTQFLEKGRFLQLQALGSSDSGRYSCTASNEAGSTSLPFQVEIHTAPTIKPGPSVVNASVNQTALLPCESEGFPLPLITWRKDGILLAPGTPRLEFLTDGSLRVHPVQSQDSGSYLCLASSSAGSDRQGRDLRVLDPPTIAPGPTNLTLTAHSQATLSCEATGSPKPQVLWKKDGQMLNLDLSQGPYRLLPSSSLLLTDPGLEDTAQFECVVTNEAGEARRTFRVSVHVPPTIADDQTDFTVTKMAPVVLTCHTTGVPAPAVSWSKGGAQLGKRGGGYSVSPRGALEISQALPIHSGRYTCTARNTAGVAYKHVLLMVQASPVVKPLPSVVQVMAEASVVIPCEASGIPRPTITWQKEGLSIPSGAGIQILPGGQLQISHVTMEDAGNFLCIAQNPSGTALGKTRLVVQVPPLIEDGPSDMSVPEGAQALLPCIAKGVPKPRIAWVKDGIPVPETEGKYNILPSGELVVKSSEPQDAGTYGCSAENAAGKSSRRVHLSVLTLPTFTTLPGDLTLNLGDRLWLRCAARGSPNPRLTWTFNSRPVSEGVSEQDGGSTLQRLAVTKDDRGTYMCSAENSMGQVGAISFVYVKEAPVLQGEATSYQVETLGGSALLDCVAHGDPTPVIHWIKDGLPMWGSANRRQLQNGSLAISRTVSDDAGRYQCVAENEVGTVEKVITLTLQSAPMFTVKPHDMAVKAGENVILPCRAAGEPAPTVEWVRKGRPLREGRRLQVRPDGTLQIQAVEATDAGEYECVAHNLLGSSIVQVFLAVKGEPRGARGSLIGIINGQEFGIATLNANVLQEAQSRTTTIRSSINNIPPALGPLMRVLVVTVVPIYWSLAGQSGEALNGFSLTRGNFRQESQVEFATGELLRLTQVARGLDEDGILLLDSVINGFVPKSFVGAALRIQDFQERYVRTGPGQLYADSTQRFQQDGIPSLFRCNHTIQYDPVPGLQPELVQHLQARSVSSAFDLSSEMLHFQLTTALQAEENEVGCPEGFVLDPQQAFCADKDECAAGQSPCSHTCHNSVGRFSCSCPSGYALAWDSRNCRDVDECAWGTQVCHDGQRCVNLLGSYHCLPHCEAGFRVATDGTGCEDIDECLENSDGCRYNQICENTVGSHRCTCPSGYRSQGFGRPCLDINECLQMPRICTYQCHNLQGGYRCLCPPGKILLRDGKSCSGLVKVDGNVTTVSLRGPPSRWLRPHSRAPGGSYHGWLALQPAGNAPSSISRAWCPPGFTMKNGACKDLDECQVRGLCQHDCQNTEGSYQCLCPSGYRLFPSGKNCQDINECVEEGIECGPSQMCFNTRGSYQCVDTPCPATYRRGSSPGMCFRRCSLECGSGGPFTLQYKLLTLPFGIRADHDVVRLAAFSEAGVLQNRTVLTVLEPDPGSPFALREPRDGRGAIYTRRPLTDSGVFRMKVQAMTYSEQRVLRYQNIFIILISVSPYPY